MNADPETLGHLLDMDAEMRVGRRLKRTLYLVDPDHIVDYENDLCVGIVDSEAMAAEITKRWNQARWQRED